MSTTPTASTPAVAPAVAKSRKTTYVVIGSLATVVVAGGLLAMAMVSRGPTAPPPTAPAKDILKFAATDAWNKLPPEQLQKYYDEFDKMSWPDRMKAMQEAQSMSEEERGRAMANFWGTRMVTQARTYARLTPDEQKKMIDKMLDEQQAAMRSMPQIPGMMRPTSRPEGAGRPGGPGGGGWNNPAAQKGRMESMAPGDRAAMAKFIGDMSQRRTERGMGGGGWGGGGGRGGGGGGGGGSNQGSPR